MGSINSIPVISQAKSLFQVIVGDEKGAQKTQEEFLRTGIIASQINSLVHSINGNNAEALKIQKEFGSTAENIVNGLPVVGHIKGAIHILANDEERGKQIILGNK